MVFSLLGWFVVVPLVPLARGVFQNLKFGFHFIHD